MSLFICRYIGISREYLHILINDRYKEEIEIDWLKEGKWEGKVGALGALEGISVWNFFFSRNL